MPIILILFISFIICSILRCACQVDDTISELFLSDGIMRKYGHPSDGYVDSLSNLLFYCRCNSTSGVDGLKLPDGSRINLSNYTVVRVNEKFSLGGSFGCICGGVLENRSLTPVTYRLCNIKEYLMINRLCSRLVSNFLCTIHSDTDMNQLRALKKSSTSTANFCEALNFNETADCWPYKKPSNSVLCLNSHPNRYAENLCDVPHYRARKLPIIHRRKRRKRNETRINLQQLIFFKFGSSCSRCAKFHCYSPRLLYCWFDFNKKESVFLECVCECSYLANT